MISWVVLLVMAGVWLFAISRIIGRLGYSRWWALPALVPFVNMFLLGWVAFREWPIGDFEDLERGRRQW